MLDKRLRHIKQELLINKLLILSFILIANTTFAGTLTKVQVKPERTAPCELTGHAFKIGSSMAGSIPNEGEVYGSQTLVALASQIASDQTFNQCLDLVAQYKRNRILSFCGANDDGRYNAHIFVKWKKTNVVDKFQINCTPF
jgi:hypothetical protein